MLGMYFIIALLSGVLTSRVHRQEKVTRDREEHTNALYQLTKEISLAAGINEVLIVSVKAVKKYFKFDCVFILQGGNNELDHKIRPEAIFELSDSELSIASWAFNHSGKAGKYTDTLPSTELTFYPLNGSKLHLGVIAAKLHQPLSGEEEIFWDTFKSQISNALEREFLNELARKAAILNESDKLYKTLFNSISHELKIPVATIMGASETLLTINGNKEAYTHLCEEIFTASERLNRLIENLLNMSRLESGMISPRLDWYDVNDLVNKVTGNLKNELQHFNLDVVIQEDMPLVKMDIGLMEQVLYNLVFNATQHGPHHTTVRIKIYYDKPNFVMQVMDRGPGFPQEAIPYVFNKFFRVEGTKSGGTGLGLSIVKGFVEAHNGTVGIENRQNGGVRITVKIPTETPMFSANTLNE
jgi:two-component system, OmpR family, sensor histidine kinase KdpD